MKKTKTYITPGIKVRTIEAEDCLLAATTNNAPNNMSLTFKKYNASDKDTYIDNSDDIGAKSSNTSDGWDDWEEE